MEYAAFRISVHALWLALPDGTSRAMTEAECVEGAPLPEGAGIVAPPARDEAEPVEETASG